MDRYVFEDLDQQFAAAVVLWAVLRCRRVPPRSARAVCQHCRTRPANRRRGLCWICYYTPDVRGMYPPVSKYGNRGVGNGYRRARLPERPTTAPPGSDEKQAVMRERAARGEILFHPLDAGAV